MKRNHTALSTTDPISATPFRHGFGRWTRLNEAEAIALRHVVTTVLDNVMDSLAGGTSTQEDWVFWAAITVTHGHREQRHTCRSSTMQ